MRILALICLTFSLLGCGYHFSGSQGLPGGVKTIYLPLFVNRTAEPLLENRLTAQVSELLVRQAGVVQVSDRAQAEAVLQGEVNSYSSRAIAYDSQDAISEYRSSLEISAKLRQVTDGRLLWQTTLSWDSDYPAVADRMLQEDLEAEAISESSRRLAEELLARLQDDF